MKRRIKRLLLKARGVTIGIVLGLFLTLALMQVFTAFLLGLSIGASFSLILWLSFTKVMPKAQTQARPNNLTVGVAGPPLATPSANPPAVGCEQPPTLRPIASHPVFNDVVLALTGCGASKAWATRTVTAVAETTPLEFDALFKAALAQRRAA